MTAGPELRDIHLPPAPSWWPPAPGWWVLAVIVLLATILLARWSWRRLRERHWRRRVRAELERIAAEHATQPDPLRLLADVSQLLRRVARLIEPTAVALRDEAWIAFLDRQWPRDRTAATRFANGAGRSLIDGAYRRDDDPLVRALDSTALLDLTREWLAIALPRGRAHA